MAEKQLSWFEDEDTIDAPDQLLDLKALINSRGWQIIANILDKQAQIRMQKLVTTPLKSLDGALEQEYIKGEAEQLLTLRTLPEVLIEELQNEVQRLKEEDARRDDDTDIRRPDLNS